MNSQSLKIIYTFMHCNCVIILLHSNNVFACHTSQSEGKIRGVASLRVDFPWKLSAVSHRIETLLHRYHVHFFYCYTCYCICTSITEWWFILWNEVSDVEALNSVVLKYSVTLSWCIRDNSLPKGLNVTFDPPTAPKTAENCSVTAGLAASYKLRIQVFSVLPSQNYWPNNKEPSLGNYHRIVDFCWTSAFPDSSHPDLESTLGVGSGHWDGACAVWTTCTYVCELVAVVWSIGRSDWYNRVGAGVSVKQ